MSKFLGMGLLLLLASASSSHAAIVDCDAALSLDCTIDLDGTNATAIYNLEISSGTFYDVVFDFVTVGTTPDLRDVFDGDASAAQAAANLLAAVLNPTDAITAKAPGSAATGQNFVVPYSYAGTASDSTCTSGLVLICGWRVSSSLVPGPNTWGVVSAELESGTVNFARFTPAAPVPLPPAVFLFASGLAVLGWIRRRPGGAVTS